VRRDYLPFSRPSISEEEIAAVGDVLRSGWLTTGPKNIEFERAFCAYTGSPGAVTVCSGTAGMHLVFHALGVGPGDEVVTPSLTWVSTVNLIVLAGATPVFADVDRDTLIVTPEVLRLCLTPRTKLVIPVHFAGAPADLDGFRALADETGVRFVEDAAHALGTEYKSVPVGRAGSSVFSFHPIKNITTGEGGMVSSDDTDLVDRIRRLKFHGLGVDAYDREVQGRSPQAEVLEPGYKYNMTDISAVLGLAQLRRIEGFNLKRTQLALMYRRKLEDVDEILPLADPPYPMTHAWHLFVVRLDVEKAGMSRDEFMRRLKEKNIGTGIHFLAVHLQRYYRERLGIERGALPNTEWNSDRILSLPLFPAMTVDDVDGVVDAIKDILKRKRK
jgi:UDP-4-amino-4-deoxy-L-arabinose-oxoglutarate aminotransferase